MLLHVNIWPKPPQYCNQPLVKISNLIKNLKKRKQKNQTEILELENKVIEQNNLIDNSSSRLNQAEDKIDEPEDGSIEIIQRSRKKIRL